MFERSTRRSWLTGGCLLLATTVLAPALPLPAGQARAAAVSEQSFASWRDGFRAEALLNGIDAGLFDRLFRGMQPDQAVIDADSSQPEFTRPIWEYLDSAASPARVSYGRQMLAAQQRTLDGIEQRYGVPRQILVAIWGMESNFGRNIGSKDVIRSLATLAWHGRRADFARTQLLAALQILQQGHYRGGMMPGSWAGAMGQTQFIPTTFLDFAVDFDGDGRKDLWQSSSDALASAANYLSRSNWQSGQHWGFEVRLPAGFDYALADPAVRRSIAQWQQLGVMPQAAIGAGESTQSATLLLPAGHRGPAFLVLSNFRSLLRYNNSTAYALGVGLLADRLAGAAALQASWPRDEKPLSRSQRVELQQRLAAAGFNPGVADGIIGANTRAAVRASQQRLGWPADGEPTLRLLEALRRQH